MTPHLTVAYGDDALLDALQRQLEQGLPLAAQARALSLMERDESGRWSLRDEFALG